MDRRSCSTVSARVGPGLDSDSGNACGFDLGLESGCHGGRKGTSAFVGPRDLRYRPISANSQDLVMCSTEPFAPIRAGCQFELVARDSKLQLTASIRAAADLNVPCVRTVASVTFSIARSLVVPAKTRRCVV
jgi:hypothetical protein